MKYRYEIPAETGFRNYTVNDAVEDLDPDGFVADEKTGDRICLAVLERAGLAAGEWDALGIDDVLRMLYWASDEEAKNDDGRKALGMITKTSVR